MFLLIIDAVAYLGITKLFLSLKNDGDIQDQSQVVWALPWKPYFTQSLKF